jgi:hypothetical protein
LLLHAEILATTDGQVPQMVLLGRCVPYVIDRANFVNRYRSSVRVEEATACRLIFWG